MLQCTPVINELQTGTTLSSANEWIELYNGCPNAVDITGWTLVYRGANTIDSTDSTVLAPLNGMMESHAFRLYAGVGYPDLSDGTFTDTNSKGLIGQNNGAVGLRDHNGALVDSLAYGTVKAGHPFIETQALEPMSNDESAARLIDGADTNNNSIDFQIVSAETPGRSNAQ